MRSPEVSKATIGRLPSYLNYLKSIEDTTENVSATVIAKEFGMGEVRVRKDLASVSGAGRPKIGYNVRELIETIDSYLHGDSHMIAVIVGAGKLGRALLDYGGFSEYGVDVSAAFDVSVTEPQISSSGKQILPMTALDGYCSEHNVKIGIITVPSDAAQTVCDRLVSCRVKGVWCFAPTCLEIPDEIFVVYENMALSLAYLGKKI